MISGKNILNELCNKNETKKSHDVSSFNWKNKNLETYIQLGGTKGWFANIHQQVYLVL